MAASSTGLTARLAAAALALSAPLTAQPSSLAALLVSSRWCHTTSTGISLTTVSVRFQADGAIVIRRDTEFGESHNGTSVSGRWEIASGVLVIHEPNGGVSRLPMTVAGSGRDTRLTLGELTYEMCR